MGVRKEFTYPSSDGAHQVHAVLWLPEGEPRAVVQLVHGISEYILRYDHFARYLVTQGFAVTGNDHLGHGQTAEGPSEYGYYTDWWALVKDVRELRETVGKQLPNVPYFLLGHSMGSFVVRTYLIDYPGTLKGAILSGTGQEPAALVANRQFKPNRTGADWICRDEAVVDAYVADPFCSFLPTAGMNHAMMGGLQYVAKRENLARMDKDMPVYFFAGDKDPVGNSGKGVEKVVGFFQRAGVKDITLKLYPGGRHE